MKLRYHMAALASASAAYLGLQAIGPGWLAVIGAIWTAGLVSFAGLIHEVLSDDRQVAPRPTFGDTLKNAGMDDQDQQLGGSEEKGERVGSRRANCDDDAELTEGPSE